MLVTAVAGAALVRAQGLPLIAEIRATLSAGLLPGRAIAEAMMVGIAGVLLMTPGYFTDSIGLLLLVPPVRSLVYREISSRLAGFAVASSARPRASAARPGAGPASGPATGPGTIDLDVESWRPR